MEARNVLIYYTSGTGNTYRVVQWIAKRAHECSWNANLVAIEEAHPVEQVTCEKDKTLLLATPTHGFTTPWHVLRFAASLPHGVGMAAYCLATRAGFRLGPILFNGMAGSCAFLLAIILAFKGYRVLGTVHVNMPSNWYSLHPMQGYKTLEIILERAEKQTQAFVDQMVTNQRIWYTKNNLYELIQGLILGPISLLYLIIGRFGLAKLFFANYRCDGCGVCAKSCSIGAIEMWGKKRPRPYWRHNCESCMRCAAICPHGAIEASHSWLAILMYLSMIPALQTLIYKLSTMASVFVGFDANRIESVLWFVYWYPAIFLSYYVFQMLLRIPILNRLFTYTTLTHYWGRYKEPTIKLRDLTPRK